MCDDKFERCNKNDEECLAEWDNCMAVEYKQIDDDEDEEEYEAFNWADAKDPDPEEKGPDAPPTE